jgi:Fur family ferric uptake transcriptional regulator
MSKTTASISAVLRDNGLSITKQRLFVFELLENREPITMAELYKLAKSHVDRASLYRTIAIFESLNIVSRVNIGWKYKIELSDNFTEHHHHMACITCQKIIEINEHELESFIESIALSHTFKTTEHQIELQGYCVKCVTST